MSTYSLGVIEKVNLELCSEFFEGHVRVDSDGDVCIEGILSVDDLKRIVEIVERNLNG